LPTISSVSAQDQNMRKKGERAVLILILESGESADHSLLIYGGLEKQKWSKGQVLGWKDTPHIVPGIF